MTTTINLEDTCQEDVGPSDEGCWLCKFCRKELWDIQETNNPSPIFENGFCCDECNTKYVIPERIKLMEKENE